MRISRLEPSARLFEADWLAQRLRPFSEHRVASIVPEGFPAYVRILHPARAVDGRVLRWADVAVRTHGIMHRLVQFHSLARSPSDSGDNTVQGISPPESGNLPPDQLKALCEVLAKHTSASDSCWFCLWDGYGWLYDKATESTLVSTGFGHPLDVAGFLAVPPLLPPDILARPKLHLPCRSYYLLHGQLDAALDLGWTMKEQNFVPQSPNLFWSGDHAWCVASEIDLFCTLVAGSEALVNSVIADPHLEACRVAAEDAITWNSDEINV
jgi:hypothetical protein